MKEFENAFSMKQVMQHWDSISEEYDRENDKVREMHDQRFREALKHFEFTDGLKLLVVWARNGEMLKYINKTKTITTICLELSYNLIKQGRDRYPKDFFSQASLHRFPIKNNTFDVVISLETIEHTPNPYIFLKEIQRVLKKGGKLIMSAPIHTNEFASILIDVFKFNHSEGPHKFPSDTYVKKLLKLINLNLKVYKPTLLIPMGPKFLYKLGCKFEEFVNNSSLENTPLKYLFFRHFYICEKE